MQGLFNFIADIGSALEWLLPMFCYVGGSGFLIGGVYGIYQRSAQANGLASRPFVPELMILAGATFLSFPQFLNMGNQTLGFDSTASLSGGNAPAAVSIDALTSAVTGGPVQVLTAILHLFRFYFMSYGALIVYFAIIRQVGRARGINNSSTGLNMVMLAGGFFVMNADVIGPMLLKELHLTSS
ncbi:MULTISPECIES: hypothetical protein [Komagataeibacter]|uniref:hypothetical protein n=1 Tax=Komagataeibacter TaxID=1434011 RepID=UPI001CD462B8|nr:hypothetical protein [Komagataeibacter rhaeticus]